LKILFNFNLSIKFFIKGPKVSIIWSFYPVVLIFLINNWFSRFVLFY
jgi:hypothetical protein